MNCNFAVDLTVKMPLCHDYMYTGSSCWSLVCRRQANWATEIIGQLGNKCVKRLTIPFIQQISIRSRMTPH